MKPLHSAPTLADAHFEIDKQINVYKDSKCSIKKLKKAKQVLVWLNESDYQELHNKYLEEEKEKITYHPDTNKYEYRWIMYNSYQEAKSMQYSLSVDYIKEKEELQKIIDKHYKDLENLKNSNIDRIKNYQETSRKLNKYLSIITIITITLVILFTILWNK